jgi:hypothetical protein
MMSALLGGVISPAETGVAPIRRTAMKSPPSGRKKGLVVGDWPGMRRRLLALSYPEYFTKRRKNGRGFESKALWFFMLQRKPKETPPMQHATPPDLHFHSFDRRKIAVCYGRPARSPAPEGIC